MQRSESRRGELGFAGTESHPEFLKYFLSSRPQKLSLSAVYQIVESLRK